jgi:DNA invertase Pin-like site-specific DNA recombinase
MDVQSGGVDTMPITDCFGYLRVSGRDQIDGDGFPRQCEAIERWAARSGHSLAAVFVERAVSGRRGLADDEVDRPAFTDMVAAILANGCRTVVVECLDRFARNLMIQTQLIVYLKSKGITLVSAMTGEDVTSFDGETDPMRWAMVQMQGVFAELDRNMTVRKLRVARDRKRRETGICEGQKPYGMDPKKPWEHATRQRIISLHDASHAAAAIADILNGSGLRTRQGALWTNRTVTKVIKRFQTTEGRQCQ